MSTTTDPLARLMSRRVVTESGCWEFTGATTNGYGRIGVGGGVMLTHRLAYELLVGSVPDGLELDHLCQNPSCMNPDHLEPVTHLENVRRGKAGEINRERMLAKTHCAQGHEWTEENTLVTKRQRVCRACRREMRARKAVAS